MIKACKLFAGLAAISTALLSSQGQAAEAAGWAYAQGSLASNFKLELGLGVAAADGPWGSLGIEGRAAANLSTLSLSHFGLDAVYRKSLGNFALFASAGYDLTRLNPFAGRPNLGLGGSLSLGSFGVRGGYQRAGNENRFTLGLEVVAPIQSESGASVSEDFLNW